MSPPPTPPSTPPPAPAEAEAASPSLPGPSGTPAQVRTRRVRTADEYNEAVAAASQLRQEYREPIEISDDDDDAVVPMDAEEAYQRQTEIAQNIGQRAEAIARAIEAGIENQDYADLVQWHDRGNSGGPLPVYWHGEEELNAIKNKWNMLLLDWALDTTGPDPTLHGDRGNVRGGRTTNWLWVLKRWCYNFHLNQRLWGEEYQAHINDMAAKGDFSVERCTERANEVRHAFIQLWLTDGSVDNVANECAWKNLRTDLNYHYRKFLYATSDLASELEKSHPQMRRSDALRLCRSSRTMTKAVSFFHQRRLHQQHYLILRSRYLVGNDMKLYYDTD